MNEDLRHKGRIAQARIYLGKRLRSFVNQSDWTVLPISALIAAVVTFVVGTDMFRTQEGTKLGVFALTCVCVWNGFFNSIQAVCREREIVKREHRAGLHMSAYIVAEMIYQLLLCLAQAVITVLICSVAGVEIPAEGTVTKWGILDAGITILLTTYAADMMALMVSSIVRTTTAAMTTMPFLLIFQLVFSGGFFALEGIAEYIKYITISHWGMDSLCCVGRYNELPMVTLWNTLVGFKDVEFSGMTPLKDILVKIEQEGYRDEFLQWSGQQNTVTAYEATVQNVTHNWLFLLILMLAFIILSIIALEFIDRDKS